MFWVFCKYKWHFGFVVLARLWTWMNSIKDILLWTKKKKYTKPVDPFRWRLPFRLSQERQWVGLAVLTHSRPANLNSILPSEFTAPWRRAKLFPRVFYTAFRLSGESSSTFSEWSYPTQTRSPSSSGHSGLTFVSFITTFSCSSCSHDLWRWNRQGVPKRRHIKFRRRGFIQKKEYNIHNTTKVWNQERSLTLQWYWAVAYRGGRVRGFKTPPRNSEGPPKLCQTQPDCENC